MAKILIATEKPFAKVAVDGIKEVAEEAPQEEAEEAAPQVAVEGAVTTISHGKVVISIKEGKDIYLELPI